MPLVHFTSERDTCPSFNKSNELFEVDVCEARRKEQSINLSAPWLRTGLLKTRQEPVQTFSDRIFSICEKSEPLLMNGSPGSIEII